MTKVLVINGSYREGGVTDQLVNVLSDTLTQAGAEIDTVILRDIDIHFCLNCRACTQQAGTAPGECVLHDNMADLVARIEASDAYILTSPTNTGSVTAVFKRFIERLTVYADWPWGAPSPKMRKANLPRKKAILLSSSAAPGLMARLMFNTRQQLKFTAKVIGADVVGTLFVGLVAKSPNYQLTDKTCQKAIKLAKKLL